MVRRSGPSVGTASVVELSSSRSSMKLCVRATMIWKTRLVMVKTGGGFPSLAAHPR